MAAYLFKTLAARNIVRRNPRQFECHVRHGHWQNDTILSESFLSTLFYTKKTAGPGLSNIAWSIWKSTTPLNLAHKIKPNLVWQKISSLTWAAGTLHPLYSWLWLVPGTCHRDSSGNQPRAVLLSLTPQMLCIGSCARQEKAAGRW